MGKIINILVGSTENNITLRVILFIYGMVMITTSQYIYLNVIMVIRSLDSLLTFAVPTIVSVMDSYHSVLHPN